MLLNHVSHWAKHTERSANYLYHPRSYKQRLFHCLEWGKLLAYAKVMMPNGEIFVCYVSAEFSTTEDLSFRDTIDSSLSYVCVYELPYKWFQWFVLLLSLCQNGSSLYIIIILDLPPIWWCGKHTHTHTHHLTVDSMCSHLQMLKATKLIFMLNSH